MKKRGKQDERERGKQQNNDENEGKDERGRKQ